MRRTRTISITSGKGGVGKTTIAGNLALALAQRGEQVLILDGDLGMANVDILFGVRPEGHLGDVLAGRKTAREILIEAAPGVHLLPGGSGVLDFNAMNNFQRRALFDAVSDLPHDFAWMIVDTAPGITDNVLYLNSACDEIAVVLTPDPASFADAYALIKVLHLTRREPKFSVVCNFVRDEADGFGLFTRFQEVVTRFLDVGLDYWGSVPLDPALRKSNQMQRLVLRHEPQSAASAAIRSVAARMRPAEREDGMKGGLRPFWSQIAGMA